MKVKFYRESNKKRNVVRAIFESNSKTCFSATGKELGGIPIFKDTSSQTLKVLLEEGDEKLGRIAKKNGTSMFLACSEEFFKKVIRATEEHEVDVNVLVTKSREMLHYLSISFEPEGENKIITMMIISYKE